MGLADLHIHTIYSYDGTASIQTVLTHGRHAAAIGFGRNERSSRCGGFA